MKRNANTTNLTKSFIESRISQELIVSKYLNIPMDIVKKCISENLLIKSVFRNNDKNGSMGIQYNSKGRLKVRDFGGFGFFEDIYGVVAYVLSAMYKRNINPNNKQDFYFILKHIANTFKDIINGTEQDSNVDTDIQRALAAGVNRKPIIEIVPRRWNKQDKKVWEKWGVSLSYLGTNFVLPVEQYYIDRAVNSNAKYFYKEKDPCYAYMLGQNSLGIHLIKLYFPLRDRTKDTKFVTNCNVLEGLLNLELDCYDIIVITKSSKDRLSIGSRLADSSINFLYGGGNIGIINLPSENYRLKQKEFDYLSNKLNDNGIIISLLDFDATGRAGARYLYNTYGIPYMFITKGEFGLPNYGCKDFSELYERYGKEKVESFIKETITYVRLKYYGESISDACF